MYLDIWIEQKNQMRIESKSLEILHSFRIKILNFYSTDKKKKKKSIN